MKVRLNNLFGILFVLLLLPLFWVSWIGLLGVRLRNSFKSTPDPPAFAPLPEKSKRLASIIILNWNGKYLLREYLPSVMTAARRDGARHEVIVVDNGSSDDSVAFLKDHHPDVRVIALTKNHGFAEGNNLGVIHAQHPIVVLLNNDMQVEKDFLEPLLEGFDQDVFAVTSQIDFIDRKRRREETGKTAAKIENGWFSFAHQSVTRADLRRSSVPVFWAGGGSSAFHREKFLWLGGFDSLFSPCYVEDTDLSMQAWKMGWKVILAPRSLVHHRHRASSSKRFSSRSLENLILRNQILFAWVNLSDWRCLLSQALLFPVGLMRRLIRQSTPGWWSLAGALFRWPAVVKRRLTRPGSSVSDAEILRTLDERFRFYRDRVQRRCVTRPDRLRILMVTAYLPHLGYHAGAGRMYHLIRHLSERHEVTVVSFLESREEEERAEPLRSLCKSVHILLRQPDYIRSLYIYEPFDAFYSRQMRRMILETLEESDYDILQFEYAQMGEYSFKECTIPQILTEHEVNFEACRLQARVRTSWIQKVAWYYNYMQVMHRELHICRPMDRIICMTERDAGYLAGQVSPNRLQVVRTGVDLDYFSPREVQEEANSMVFVGSFNHYPNSDAMIHFCREIFPRVLARVPTARLYVVGAGPAQELVHLSQGGRITVTGYIEDLRPYLSRAALYIVPLRLGVGIRGKILEAWAMQRPVIATPLACAGLPVEHGRNIWVSDTAPDFANGIIRLLGDASLRQRLGRQGRLAAESRFGWREAANQLESIYYEVLTDGEGRPAKNSATPAEVDSRAD